MWFFNRKKKLNQSLIDEIKAEKCDMESLFSNINNRSKAEVLYKELAKLIHPDRFMLDPEKLKIATDLFSELQAQRTNYNAMLEIKEKIESLLERK